MGFEVNCQEGEREGFSCKLYVADRMFYIKNFANPAAKTQFFSCNTAGIIEKEISKTEFELWLNILADSNQEINQIQKSISSTKKF
jgi:hypothetical protein